jgi:hypothetical protein
MHWIPKHKVFISYHHANDEPYKRRFIQLFSEILDGFVDNSVEEGDIDPDLPADRIFQIIRDKYIRKTTVTVVLVGSETWKRKHVDWEIATSLWNGPRNSRNGLVGILLPTHPSYWSLNLVDKFDPCVIPPRLYDNIKCGYAKLYPWKEDLYFVKAIIHEAFENRFRATPDNSYPRFKYNRCGDSWC